MPHVRTRTGATHRAARPGATVVAATGVELSHTRERRPLDYEKAFTTKESDGEPAEGPQYRIFL